MTLPYRFSRVMVPAVPGVNFPTPEPPAPMVAIGPEPSRVTPPCFTTRGAEVTYTPIGK